MILFKYTSIVRIKVIIGFAEAMLALAAWLIAYPRRGAIWAPLLLVIPGIWLALVKGVWLVVLFLQGQALATPPDPPGMLMAMCALLVVAAPLATWEIHRPQKITRH